MAMSSKQKATAVVDRFSVATETWHLSLDLSGWLGSYCHIETTDGVTREGKITLIEWHRFDLAGTDGFAWPKAIELNGDPIDRIELPQIFKMRLR